MAKCLLCDNDTNSEESNLNPIAVHLYPSGTQNRIYSTRDKEIYNAVLQYLKDLFVNFDFRMDNKVVFEVEKNGYKFFYGFYDNRFTIGTSCTNEYGYKVTKEGKNF